MRLAALSSLCALLTVAAGGVAGAVEAMPRLALLTECEDVDRDELELVVYRNGLVIAHHEGKEVTAQLDVADIDARLTPLKVEALARSKKRSYEVKRSDDSEDGCAFVIVLWDAAGRERARVREVGFDPFAEPETQHKLPSLLARPLVGLAEWERGLVGTPRLDASLLLTLSDGLPVDWPATWPHPVPSARGEGSLEVVLAPALRAVAERFVLAHRDVAWLREQVPHDELVHKVPSQRAP